jgi:hypothetical protein
MTNERTPATPTARADAGDDLERLRKATEATYAALRAIDEDDLPPERIQEYWRDRYLARTAWESAENAAFADLVTQQQQQLPAVRAANQCLADDVRRTGDALTRVGLVSASLGVLASVIALLA